MKKVSIVLFFLLLTSSMFAQLNSNATKLKNAEPDDFYQEIRLFAINEWQDDNTMIIYIINMQADAIFELGDIIKSGKVSSKIIERYAAEWAKTIEGRQVIDYHMVVYNLRLHMNNSNY